MEQITDHFHRKEFACQGEHCCDHSAPIDMNFVEMLEKLRNMVGPLRVTSGFRCRRHNATVPGAAENSSHTLGLAADVVSADGSLSPQELAEAALDSDLGFCAVVAYDSFVHIDVDDDKGPRTWDTKETDR